MIKFDSKTFMDRVKFKVWVLRICLFLMIAYMLIVGESGLGDFRMMNLAGEIICKTIYFSGLMFIVIRFMYNRNLFLGRNKAMTEKRRREHERKYFLHEKSGGIVVDTILMLLLFASCITALWDIGAFYVTSGMLIVGVVMKVIVYIIYDKFYVLGDTAKRSIQE